MAFIQAQKQPVSLHGISWESLSNFIWKTVKFLREEGQKRKNFIKVA